MTHTPPTKGNIMAIRRPPRPSDDNVYIPTGFIRNTEISREAKLAYISTAARRQQGEADPDHGTIAKEMGLGIAQVAAGERELNELSDAEWKRMGL